MSSLERFWAVIPAGGAGTRLWPLSRASSPKFLHDL
ncbi:MAG TPA: sugar phosphate nucleotidyltransferase, partial [Pedococcus sp.]